jgi:hypothetical protein
MTACEKMAGTIEEIQPPLTDRTLLYGRNVRAVSVGSIFLVLLPFWSKAVEKEITILGLKF